MENGNGVRDYERWVGEKYIGVEEEKNNLGCRKHTDGNRFPVEVCGCSHDYSNVGNDRRCMRHVRRFNFGCHIDNVLPRQKIKVFAEKKGRVALVCILHFRTAEVPLWYLMGYLGRYTY